MKNKNIIISIITAGLLLSACGGGGSGEAPEQNAQTATVKSQKNVAYLVDAPIVGAIYKIGEKIDTTKEGGAFFYDKEAISFYIGDLFLGKIDKIPDDKVVMLQDVLGVERNDLTNEKLIKAATLIQSLDSDPSTRAIELKEGILKGDEYKEGIDKVDIDKILKEKGIAKKSKVEVARHLRVTLDSVTDNSMPNLKSINPTNNQKNVPLNTSIELKFSKFIHYHTFLNKISLKDKAGNNIAFNTYLNENIMTIKPHSLKQNTTYTLVIDGIKDFASNGAKKLEFNFTTLKGNELPSGTPNNNEAATQTQPNNQPNQPNENTSQPSATYVDITTSKGSEISWDKKTVFDGIGKIEDRVDLAVVKGFGMTNFGNDLATSERVVNLHGKNNHLVATSKYHNALNVVDYDNGSYSYNKFASFKVNYITGLGGLAPIGGASVGGSTDLNIGGGSSSGGVDTSSGASSRSLSRALYEDESCKSEDVKNPKNLWEHSLEDAKITSNGGYVYALVLPRFDIETYNKDATFGLFRTKVGYCGVNPYNAKSTNKVDSRGISKIELASDDSKLAVYGKADSQNILRVYNSTLTSVISAVNLDDLASFDFAFNDSFIVGAMPQTYTQKAKLIKLKASNLSQSEEKIIPFSADTILGADDKVIALSKTKRLIGLFDINLNMLKEIKVNFDIEKSAISPDGKYLALGNKQSLHIYSLANKSITKLTSAQTDGLRALSFVNNSLLAYTPNTSANSVITLKLEAAQNGTQEVENETIQLEELGNFTTTSPSSSVDVFGKTKLVTSSVNKVLSYTQIAADDKGYNVFDISTNEFKFTEGSKSSVSKVYRDEILKAKMLGDDSFIVVTTNHNYPSFSSLYVQKILKDGKLTDGYNTTNNANNLYIGNYGTPLSAKIAKNSNTVFVAKKALVQNYMLVDIYSLNTDKFTAKQLDIPLEHLTTHENSIAPTDSGDDFYSFGKDKLYQHTTQKSVDVKNINGVFFATNLVFATTSDGKLYTFDKNLSSKKAYKFDFGRIKDIGYSGSNIAIFAESGVFTLKVENGTLKADKRLSISSLVGGYVSENKIFAISNSPYNPNSPDISYIYHATF